MRTLLALVAMTGLQACSAPEITLPAAPEWLPPGESAGAQPATPKPGEPMPLDLVTLLRLAGDQPLEIALAAAQAAVATAELSSAESLWWPSITPRLTFVRHEGDRTRLPIAVIRRSADFHLGIES